MDVSFFFLFDLAGVFVFALTGALAASRTDMDIFGHIVLAMLPAIGGGTLRDLMLDVPIFWLNAPLYIWTAVAAAFLIFWFPPRLGRRLFALEWADALGLALFCVMGTSKAFAVTGNITVSVTMGVITAAAGGMLRDIVCAQVPLILRKEIYATAALLGGLIYCSALKLGAPDMSAMLIGGAFAFALRGCALYFGWSLPQKRTPKTKS